MNTPKIAAMVGLATSLFVTAGAGAAEYNFKLHHFLGPQTPSHLETVAPWAEAIEKASDGRVEIEIFPSMSLGGTPPELVGQARDGVVDIVWTVNGYTAGLFPRTEVFELPFVHRNDPKATNLAMHDLFEDELRQEYKGLEVMFLHVHQGNGLHTVDKEVRSPEDVAGLKIRTPSRTGAWTIEALDAAPAAMPVPSLPQALSKKTVDAAFVPFEIIPSLKLEQQTNYQIEGADQTRFGTLVFQMSMNKGRWDALPEDIQQIFKDHSGPEWLAHLGQVWAENDDEGIAQAIAAGNTHIVLDQAQTDAFEKALEPVIARWVDEATKSGIDGEGLLQKARAAIEKHVE
ncbi:TRAP transporter substrate-binding protein [Maritalea mediterranea]|uniref:TRAP transporter substrate-binding protein n=1 Tax=Maritalea mediterranea TaxID=2909667 RepID=A0ABS9E548_9HYPH|nr:TRAP transporter substrate-binding protein [Maritalea mediterranea]MCF4097976.1 TRAP transporter substrate-binding protein [Maritalea mediterranea]